MSASAPDATLGLRRAWPWLLAALAVHVLPFAARPSLIGGDEPHYALAAHSIAADGDLALEDDYLEVAQGSSAAGRKRAGQVLDRHLRSYGDRTVFAHPLGLPALAAPGLWVLHRVAPHASPDLLLGLGGLVLTFAALVGGWWLLVRLLGDVRTATLAAVAVAFATPVWFYSRLFFTEAYAWALVVLALVAAARGRWALAGLPLGLAFLVKETAVLLILPVLAYAAIHHGRRRTLALALGPALALVAFAVKNLVVYGSPWVTFQPFQIGSPLAGALGLLLDPRHGLLPFAPVLLVAAAGWSVRGRSAASPLLPYAAFVAVAYFAVTAAWVDWRGGTCFGPRLLVPAIPAFAVPLAHLLACCGRRTVVGLVVASAAAGFAVQLAAALDPFRAFWSPSVAELLAARPGAMAVAALAGVAAVWWHVQPAATDR